MSDGGPNWEYQKARVKDIARRVEERLGLGYWEIVHLFNEGSDGEGEKGGESMASAAPQAKYLYGEITWNLYAVLQVPDATIERTCIHELVHVLMGPLHEFIPDKPEVLWREELATEMIARAIRQAMGTTLTPAGL